MHWVVPLAWPSLGTAWARVLFGWIMSARRFRRAGVINQDVVVPMEAGPAVIDDVQRTLGIYPLKLCPCLNISLSSPPRPDALLKMKRHDFFSRNWALWLTTVGALREECVRAGVGGDDLRLRRVFTIAQPHESERR